MQDISTYQIEAVHTQLFVWWAKWARVLPWRARAVEFSQSHHQGLQSSWQVREPIIHSYFHHSFRDPYLVVVSEVMLQQTQVSRVIEKYQAWIAKWPTLQALSRASLAEIITEWKGLGYNRRARFLWLLSKAIVEEKKGEWPRTQAELLKLPGIGQYTARAVLSFSFGQQVGVVDTNVKRILQRVWGVGQDNVGGNNKLNYFELADQLLPRRMADPWNQALMDFGAMVCTAKQPKCAQCPLDQFCWANQQAKSAGYTSFQHQLLAVEAPPKPVQRGKDYVQGAPLKFAYTDRFLRGRIINYLREKSWEKDALVAELSTKYTQFTSTRIWENLQRLEREGMISISKNVIALFS